MNKNGLVSRRNQRVESARQTGFAVGTAVLGLVILITNASCKAHADFSEKSQQSSSSTCPSAPSAVVISPSVSGAAITGHLLGGHIPRAVKHMTDLGKMANERELSVTVALRLNNEAELDRSIAEMYRPGSSHFHQFLTPQKFKSRYSPSEKQVAHEIAFLKRHGIHVQSVSENRVLLHATGAAKALNSAFKTELHQFRDHRAKTHFAPAFDLQAPPDSLIQAVVGLSDTAHYHTHLKSLNSGVTSRVFQGGVAPTDILSAYQIPNTVDGSGQTLALFELDGYNPSDIAAYEAQFGLDHVQLQNFLLDGADGSAGSGAVEVTLDIEMMIAVAPKAAKILIYEGPNSSQGLIDTYAKIANDNLAPQISTSWGEAEDRAAAADVQAENTIFKQMVSQGQSLFAAAGDNGANDDGSTIGVDDPASQPFVIGVGGTKLTLTSGGNYGGETTWNELSNGQGGGGGGVSTIWSTPSWQQNINPSNLQVSQSMRNVPDVSLNADPVSGYAVYVQGGWQQVGGTSAAAPLWAAFTALVNQQRSSAGLGGAGFLSPALYAIGSGASYADSFNDIADGSNNGNYNAVTGYDNATGLGTLKGVGLLAQLAGPAPGADSSAPEPAATPTPSPGPEPAPTSSPAPAPNVCQ